MLLEKGFPVGGQFHRWQILVSLCKDRRLEPKLTLTAASSSHGSPVRASQEEFRPPHPAGQALVLAWSLVSDYARPIWRRCG
jgi:hypothetical protein